MFICFTAKDLVDDVGLYGAWVLDEVGVVAFLKEALGDLLDGLQREKEGDVDALDGEGSPLPLELPPYFIIIDVSIIKNKACNKSI